MRFFRILAGLILLVAAASATELKIKVVDPQSVPVAGAQVELFPGDSSTPAAIQTTSADGLALFHELRFFAVPRPRTRRRICDTER